MVSLNTDINIANTSTEANLFMQHAQRKTSKSQNNTQE